jgi:uncharacterized membrane protein
MRPATRGKVVRMPMTTRRWLLLSFIPVALAVSAAYAAGEDTGPSGFSMWQLLGRVHVLMIHFPIALLVIVGVIEALSWRRRVDAPDATTTLLTVFAAESALAAAAMGWVRADAMSFSGRQAELVTVHRWLGVATAMLALAVTVAAQCVRRRNDAWRRGLYRAVVVLAVAVVSVTGHYGGLLVHGEHYISAALPAWAKSATPKIGRGEGRGVRAASPRPGGGSPDEVPGLHYATPGTNRTARR